MLVHANTSLRHVSCAITPFCRRKPRQYFVRTCQKVHCLPVGLDLHDHLKPSLGHRKSPFPLIGKMGSGGVLEANLHEFPHSSSYEYAMEALSSLITRQKRGDKPNIGGKFGKLERMHMYIKVDVAIIEVGLGGRNDSTNVIKEPVVCGISSLGMDHVEALGNTLREIASHKAGIFKPQISAFTVPQLSEAMDVLQEKASELMVPLKVVPPLDPTDLNGQKLSLSGDHQYTNAALAVSLCRHWLQKTVNSTELLSNGKIEAGLSEPFLRGLATARLSGRAQIVYDSSSKACNTSKIKEDSPGDLIFYLDGAHSPESMEVCARWFSDAVKQDRSSSFKDEIIEKSWQNGVVRHERENFYGPSKISKQILLFNCMEVRDPQVLLPKLVTTCASSGVHFSKALFVPSMSTYNKVTSASVISSDNSTKDLSWQSSLQRIWEKIFYRNDAIADENSKLENQETLPSTAFLHGSSQKSNPAEKHFACSAVMPSLPLTIKWLRDCVRENPSVRVQVLVTGSLHLVGDVLKLLKR